MAQAIKSEPLTPADRLRELLTLCEERVVSPDAEGGVAELFQWLDEIAALWPQLEATGIDLRAERTRWESLQAQIRQRAPQLLRAWRQQRSLAEARRSSEPDRANWWWWLDELVASERRRRLRRLLTGALAAAAGVALVIFLLGRLFPVDPRVKQVQELQMKADEALHQGDLLAARAGYAQAATVDPQDPELQLMLGAISEALGDEAAAEQAWQRARQLTTDEAEFLALRGRAYLQTNQVDKALLDEQKAVELRPDYALAYFFLGTAYELKDNEEEAILAYSKAADLALEDDPQLVVLARTRMATLLQRQAVPELPKPSPTPVP